MKIKSTINVMYLKTCVSDWILVEAEQERRLKVRKKISKTRVGLRFID